MTHDGAATRAAGSHRPWLLAVGMVLTAASAVYLVLFAREHWAELPPLKLSWSRSAWLLGGGLLYLSSLVTTSIAWWLALRGVGGVIPAHAAMGAALASQIGKYVPGNVVHHFGRAALAKSRGIHLTAIAKASISEVAVCLGASAIVAGASSLASPKLLEIAKSASTGLPHSVGFIVAAGVGVLAVLIGVAVYLWRSPPHGMMLRANIFLVSAGMLACYCFGFVFAGVSYFAVARALGQSPDLALCIGIYALAWVVGFVTPGAPAGLGVRETILVIALSASLGPAAISVAIAHRVVTAVTDAVGAGVGLLAIGSKPSNPNLAVRRVDV